MSATIRCLQTSVYGLSVLVLLATARQANAQADITYHNIHETRLDGTVGTIRAYSLGTRTCNMSTTHSLSWVNGNTPGVGFNAYRLADGRLMQIGMSWVKHACCVSNTSGCGITCGGGFGLRPGCMDTYSSSWNSSHTYLGPRSGINPYLATFTQGGWGSGNAIFKRLQVETADMQTPGALFFGEGVYVCAEESQSTRQHNNASYRRITINQSTFAWTLQNSTQVGIPAIQAWYDHGLGVNVPDPSVDIFTVDVPNEGRYWVANKVTDLGGQYRYDYAIFNLNSDRAGGSFSVPLPSGTSVSNTGFHAPPYHSGEIYSNTPWTMSTTSNSITWSSPQTFAQNPNTNALRWGTMYNFWFETARPPQPGTATFGLFKPHTPQSVAVSVLVPVGCDGMLGDINEDGNLDGEDIQHFVACYLTGDSPGGNCACADLNENGSPDIEDINFLVRLLLSPF
jgi:hypothetical protein